MTTAIFMSSNVGSLKRVYYPALHEKMARELTFLPDLTAFDTAAFDARAEELKTAEVIFSTWGMPHLTREQIRAYLPNTRAVFYGAGSVQGFAREFIDEGVTVVSAWAANAVPVAQFTASEVMLACKGYYQRLPRVPGENWYNYVTKYDFPGIYHAKVGVIGAGMVGRAVIGLLHELGADVLVFDPFLSDANAEKLGVKKVPLEELFSSCDVITNHLANNPQTVGMLNGKLFDRMKPYATFINTGRGAQVVEADLCKALQDQPGRVALLDVTWPEPPAEGSPLYRLPNVFLSPHIAGSLGGEVGRMGEYMWDEFQAFKEGRPLKYAVTSEMLKTMA